MTNFEWVKNNDTELMDTLSHGLAVNADTGRLAKCSIINCSDCLFSSSKNRDRPCQQSREEWLKKEYEPLYKEGDIVLSKKGILYVVFKECEGNLKGNDLIVAENAVNFDVGLGTYISKDKIKRKVGNIFESEE